MSLNKSQGQEMDTNLLDLRNPVFAHGHLYVGLSRVRDASKIAIFTTTDLIRTIAEGHTVAVVRIVVYPELLRPVGITEFMDVEHESVSDDEITNITSTYDSQQDGGIEDWEALLAEFRFLSPHNSQDQMNTDNIHYDNHSPDLEMLGYDESKD